MPAKSEKQRKLAGIALSIKRGKTPKGYSLEAARLARTMTATQLKDYAEKPIVKPRSKIHKTPKRK